MKKITLILLAILFALCSNAQNVGIGTSTPDASSKLEINSNNTGLLIPRLTAVERMAIINPANGLLVYDNDSTAFAYHAGAFGFF